MTSAVFTKVSAPLSGGGGPGGGAVEGAAEKIQPKVTSAKKCSH